MFCKAGFNENVATSIRLRIIQTISCWRGFLNLAWLTQMQKKQLLLSKNDHLIILARTFMTVPTVKDSTSSLSWFLPSTVSQGKPLGRTPTKNPQPAGADFQCRSASATKLGLSLAHQCLIQPRNSTLENHKHREISYHEVSGHGPISSIYSWPIHQLVHSPPHMLFEGISDHAEIAGAVFFQSLSWGSNQLCNFAGGSKISSGCKPRWCCCRTLKMPQIADRCDRKMCDGFRHKFRTKQK